MKEAITQDTHILITGGAGFIGFHLAQRLLKDGISVTVLDNMNDYYDVSLKEARLEILKQYPSFRFIKADIAEKSKLLSVFESFKPDIVINLAAQAGVRYSFINPESYIKSNIIGFFNVLEACRKYPVKHLLFASSSSVYGANKTVPFSTEDKTDYPISLYAATKKSNESMAYSYCASFGIKATGLRFFTVYGPFGRPDMAYFSFTDNIVEGKPIKVFNSGNLSRDFTYIDDIVDGILLILPHAPQPDINGCPFKLYNIGNNQPVMLMEFISELETQLGITAEKVFVEMQKGDVYTTYADISQIQNDFGFYPKTSIKDGLKEFVHWYKTFYPYKFLKGNII